jgi:hypothetical protein
MVTTSTPLAKLVGDGALPGTGPIKIILPQNSPWGSAGNASAAARFLPNPAANVLTLQPTDGYANKASIVTRPNTKALGAYAAQ